MAPRIDTPDNTSNVAQAAPAAIPTVNTGDEISQDKMNQMINVLENLLSHTHVFVDDYGTACNCNCNCNCTRGTI